MFGMAFDIRALADALTRGRRANAFKPSAPQEVRKTNKKGYFVIP
jgi:hypothetical protein